MLIDGCYQCRPTDNLFTHTSTTSNVLCQWPASKAIVKVADYYVQGSKIIVSLILLSDVYIISTNSSWKLFLDASYRFVRKSYAWRLASINCLLSYHIKLNVWSAVLECCFQCRNSIKCIQDIDISFLQVFRYLVCVANEVSLRLCRTCRYTI